MKYGLYSVEAMLNEMYKLGCSKNNMAVKISGGADIVNVTRSGKSIGHRNVEFAMDFCQEEGFRGLSNHTRGIEGKVILLTNRFETFIKTVESSSTNNDVARDEKRLQDEISIRKPALSEYTSGTGIFEIDDKNEDAMEIDFF
jgi:chemotaxis protein CheD